MDIKLIYEEAKILKDRLDKAPIPKLDKGKTQDLVYNKTIDAIANKYNRLGDQVLHIFPNFEHVREKHAHLSLTYAARTRETMIGSLDTLLLIIVIPSTPPRDQKDNKIGF